MTIIVCARTVLRPYFSILGLRLSLPGVVAIPALILPQQVDPLACPRHSMARTIPGRTFSLEPRRPSVDRIGRKKSCPNGRRRRSNSLLAQCQPGSLVGADACVGDGGTSPRASGPEGVVPVGSGASARLCISDSNSFDRTSAATIPVDNVKKAGVPVVVIPVSRPVIISEVLLQVDAFLAAFLPGTEGGGVAGVLFGSYKPTGKLSFSWPRSNDQLPLNIHLPKNKYNPLFPVGYGLT